METVNDCTVELQGLSDKHYLSALKSSKGKLAIKAVRTRLAELSAGGEYTVLANYLETDKQLKAASKTGKKLFEEAETRFLAQVTEDPLPEELQNLQATVSYLELLDQQAELKAEIKEAEEKLDLLVYEKYPQLTEDEVKTLVVDDKWLTTLATAVQSELERVSQTLTGRIRELAERYAMPLPKLVDEVEMLASRVEEHFKKMRKPV